MLHRKKKNWLYVRVRWDSNTGHWINRQRFCGLRCEDEEVIRSGNALVRSSVG